MQTDDVLAVLDRLAEAEARMTKGDNLGHPPNVVRCLISRWYEDSGTEVLGITDSDTASAAIAECICAALWEEK